MLQVEMVKKTLPSRHPGRVLLGAAAFLAACALMAPFSTPAQAQSGDAVSPRTAEPPMLQPLAPPESRHGGLADDAAPERGEAPTKKQRIDQLFEELAALGPDDERRRKQVSDDISILWSHSGSDSMDLLLLRGRKAMEAGELHRALDHFTALTDHAPGFPEGWNARATTFFLLEEWGLALADIERTLELEPRHFGALTGLAVILEKIDRPRDALAAWRRALAVHPHLERAEKAIERLSVEVEGRGI